MKTTALLLTALCLAGAAIADVTLVRDGKPAATIVTPDQPTAMEQFLAERLRFYVKEMTGAELPLVKEDANVTGSRVFIGKTKAAAARLARLGEMERETGIIAVAGDTVLLAGIDDAGTSHALYMLLESLGCRWYFPAPWGWVIPKSATITIPEGERARAPSFAIRAGIGNPRSLTDASPDWQVNEWARANHLGGWSWWGAGHSYQYFVDFKQFDQHPEWFAFYNGKRHPTQLCTTNPEVRKMALQVVLDVLAKPNAPELICVSPCDGQGFCECDNCRKFIPNDGKDTTDSIDRMVEFANYIADNIREQYPTHYVTYYCDYHSVGTPRIVTPAKNTVFWITQWAQDQLHPVTPDSPMGKSLARWSQYGSPIFLYTYWGSYGSFTYWPAATTIGADVPTYRSKGAIGVYSETHENWGGQHPDFILFPRMLWDSQADPQAYLNEFCNKAFGPAAAPMREYYKILEDTAAAGPAQYHLHSEIMAIFAPPVMARLRQCLDQAKAALAAPGTDPKCAQRLAFVEASWQLADLYYGANDLKAKFGATKDPAVRAEMVARYKAVFDLINRPDLKDRLIENWMFEAGLRQELAGLEDGTAFAPGKFTYEDGFERGGKAPLDALKITGFTNGVWGLNLPPKAAGTITYCFAAKEGAFTRAAFTQFVTCHRGRSLVQVSTQGPEGPWQEVINVPSPAADKTPPVTVPLELGQWVKDQPRFWLQVTLDNGLGTDEVCAFDLMRIEGEVK